MKGRTDEGLERMIVALSNQSLICARALIFSANKQVMSIMTITGCLGQLCLNGRLVLSSATVEHAKIVLEVFSKKLISKKTLITPC